MSSRAEWVTFASFALPIVAGAVLIALGHATDGGGQLVTLGGGAIVGYQVGRRRNGNGSSLPPRAAP